MSDKAMDITSTPLPNREVTREVALRRWQYLAISVVYLVLFVTLNRLTVSFSHIMGISAFYPPAGLTMVLLLRFGLRFTPVVALAALLGELNLWPTPVVLLPLTVIIAGGYTLAAHVLRRVARLDLRFRRVQDMAAFLYIVILAAVLVGGLSTAVLAWAGAIPIATYPTAFLNWWIGDAVGILAVAPGLLLLLTSWDGHGTPARAGTGPRFTGWALAEAVVWLLGTLLIIHYVFTTPATQLFHLLYFIFLPLIWIGLRWGVAGATAGVFAITVGVVLAIWTTVLLPDGILDTQLFMLVLVATGLLIGAMVTEQQETQAHYAEERALLASAVDLLPLPMLFIAPDGHVWRANAASREFFSTPLRSWWELILLTADTRAPLTQAERPAACALRKGVRQTMEVIVVPEEGREIPALIHAAPIEVNGRLVGAVVAIQDITALKEADRAKDRFLDVLSHELKTPLTSILGWTQAARADPQLTPQALEIIERNARAQRRMLDDLLDVSHLLHGKLALRRERVEAWSLAAATAADLAEAIAARRLTLTLEGPDTPLPIEADARRIRQAIANLLDNAIKFTEPGGAIAISGRRDNHDAVITIRDTGRGIPAELLGTLFAPFRQIQRTEITGGLGLGLILVKGIIELHGGRVSASSEGPGKGSSFIIRLPLADDSGFRI